MGSTNWGHQRKAVAIVMTDAFKKSSAYLQKFSLKAKKQF
ncbi:hypothetical protein [Citrobacter pasteurii]|nr:hypothetical protein [Citrobacter pasteurii]